MGGPGSGGRWHSGGPTTSDYRQLDVRRWQREGFLEAGQSFNWRWSRDGETLGFINVRTECGRVILSYRTRRDESDPWEAHEYPVWLDWTRCNYGGQRPWFECPAQGCRRRVAILYLGRIAACRHCYRLAYQSQRETAYDRALRRAQAIRVKLGGSCSMADEFPDKPKGMHWRTYDRLCDKAEEASYRSWPPWALRMIEP